MAEEAGEDVFGEFGGVRDDEAVARRVPVDDVGVGGVLVSERL